jgi:hypothetical protein
MLIFIRNAVFVILSLWVLSPTSALAQDGPRLDEVRLRFERAEGTPALRLSIARGPEGVRRGTICKVPCDMRTLTGNYTLRFGRGGLQRATPRHLPIYESQTYRVEYRSRQGLRAFGGIIATVSFVMGITMLARARQMGRRGDRDEGFFEGVSRVYGQAISGAIGGAMLLFGLPLGTILAIVPDRARLVPAAD